MSELIPGSRVVHKPTNKILKVKKDVGHGWWQAEDKDGWTVSILPKDCIELQSWREAILRGERGE